MRSAEQILLPFGIIIDMENRVESKIKKNGRPSKINTLDLRQVETLASFGLTDKQIADVIGVTEQSINNYKKDEKFFESLKKGKEIADQRVERSLFERATGYSHPEDKIFCNPSGKVTTVQTIKYYAPDTIACIFWLKNRKSEEWQDRQVFKGEGFGKTEYHYTIIKEYPKEQKEIPANRIEEQLQVND